MSKIVFNGWNDITLKQYIELNKGIENLKDEELAFHLVATVTDNTVEYLKEFVPFDKVVKCSEQIMQTLSEPPKKTKPQSIGAFKLPNWRERIDDSWWSNATFNQVEVATLEMQRIQELNKEDLSNFALLCATLYKKDGEIQTDELIMSRENMFLEMSMSEVWQVFFSLLRWQKLTIRNLKLYSIVLKASLKLAHLMQRVKKSMNLRKQD